MEEEEEKEGEDMELGLVVKSKRTWRAAALTRIIDDRRAKKRAGPLRMRKQALKRRQVHCPFLVLFFLLNDLWLLLLLLSYDLSAIPCFPTKTNQPEQVVLLAPKSHIDAYIFK